MIEGNLLITTIQWLGEKWKDYLSPIVVLKCYEGGVLLRLGKYKKELKEGINWKIPIIDEIHTTITTIDTFHISPVQITTIDNKQVTIEPILKFDIVDVKKYLLETNEAIGNIKDVSKGVIADYLTDCSWEQIKEKKTLTAIKNKLKSECDELGINIYKVYFGRIVSTKVYTVFKE